MKNIDKIAKKWLEEILDADDDGDEERLAWAMQMARAEMSGGFGDEWAAYLSKPRVLVIHPI